MHHIGAAYCYRSLSRVVYWLHLSALQPNRLDEPQVSPWRRWARGLGTADSCGPQGPLGHMHIGASWQIRWDRLCCGADVALLNHCSKLSSDALSFVEIIWCMILGCQGYACLRIHVGPTNHVLAHWRHIANTIDLSVWRRRCACGYRHCSSLLFVACWIARRSIVGRGICRCGWSINQSINLLSYGISEAGLHRQIIKSIFSHCKLFKNNE